MKEWETQLLQYRSKQLKEMNSLDIFKTTYDTVLSLEEQFFLISSIPNNHKWLWSNPLPFLKFEQKFTTSKRYFPGSPRNRIIQYFHDRENYQDIFIDVLKNVIGEKVTIRYSLKRAKGNSSKRKSSHSLAEALGYSQVEVNVVLIFRYLKDILDIRLSLSSLWL